MRTIVSRSLFLLDTGPFMRRFISGRKSGCPLQCIVFDLIEIKYFNRHLLSKVLDELCVFHWSTGIIQVFTNVGICLQRYYINLESISFTNKAFYDLLNIYESRFSTIFISDY